MIRIQCLRSHCRKDLTGVTYGSLHPARWDSSSSMFYERWPRLPSTTWGGCIVLSWVHFLPDFDPSTCSCPTSWSLFPSWCNTARPTLRRSVAVSTLEKNFLRHQRFSLIDRAIRLVAPTTVGFFQQISRKPPKVVFYSSPHNSRTVFLTYSKLCIEIQVFISSRKIPWYRTKKPIKFTLIHYLT